MPFEAPSWASDFSLDSIPDSIPISEFILNEKYGRRRQCKSKSPFVCGLSGRQYFASEVTQRVEWLARALSQRLRWEPNTGSPWSKVITIYALNTIDTLPLSWAVHRLSGISSPANAAYNSSELTYQLKASKSRAIFTCLPLLETALTAARNVGIEEHHVYILALPDEALAGTSSSTSLAGKSFKSVDELIAQGKELPPLENLVWEKGQGARQCAFLNFSSGTTGLPKGVMVSHKNVIANILQLTTFEKPTRTPDQQDVVLGLLPQSHIYGLVVVNHVSVYRGESVVVMPKFDLKLLARAIERFRINTLFIVPPIAISMLNNQSLLRQFDFSSVREIFTGAAHLDAATCKKLLQQYPTWKIRQAYGLTETATVVSATSIDDVILGTSGNLIPGVQARLVSLSNGTDISAFDTSGELFVQSPSVTNLGYLDNPKASAETFVVDPSNGDDCWLRTGDEAMFVRGAGGPHLVIVDRIKELIKVKGHQVPPAELEACLLTHAEVADAAVIPVPDPSAGEVPKAFVVLKRAQLKSLSEQEKDRMKRDLQAHIQKEKARYKWLKGGVELVDSIPKSPSGKILRRILRDKEKEKRRKSVATKL